MSMDIFFTVLAAIIGALLAASGVLIAVPTYHSQDLERGWKPALYAVAAVLFFFGFLILAGSISAIAEAI